MVFTTEERKEYNKNYYKNNKQKQKENIKNYRKTEKGKEVSMISNWKQKGVIHDNFEELYNKYLNTKECNVCKYVFDKTNRKCLDHDHETGLFRNVLCHKCNNYDNWKKLI
jgi:hypothetical protein